MASAEDTINRLHRQYLALLGDETTFLGTSSPLTPEQRTKYAAAVTVAWNNYASVQIALLNQDQATIDHVGALVEGAQQTLDSALKDLNTLGESARCCCQRAEHRGDGAGGASVIAARTGVLVFVGVVRRAVLL